MDKRNERNNILSFKQFLNEFCENLKEKSDDLDCIPLRFHNPRVTADELEGECLDWVLNYLSTRDCPSVLAAHVAREVYLRVSGSDLDPFLNDNNTKDGRASEDGENENSEETQNEQKNRLIEYNAETLNKHVLDSTESVCKSWAETLPDLPLSNSYHKVSFNAIKNTRRKMEDTHIIAQDLNALFGLKDEPWMSFYGVFDGHAGTDASLFTSKHIHRNLVHHGCLDKNPAEALRSAFRVTDEQFIPKAKREKWRSGTTGVTALVRENTAYLSWLGDSQAVLVKDGRCVTHMEPHKPERQDERDRIESQGGFVMMVGDLWRVGGNIAVSRAIGDVAYKPFISSEAEVTTVELDGTEDYMILACDGLWDVVSEEDLPKLVYNFLIEADGDQSSIAKSLVQHAKDNDSTDNISVVVIFFREKISEPKSDSGLLNFLMGDSTQGASDQSGNGKGGEKGDQSKDSDGKEGKGGNSDNPADTVTDQQSQDDQTVIHSVKDNSSLLQSKESSNKKDTLGDGLTRLDYPNQEDIEEEVYTRIGHILGLESPESTEFVNNIDNYVIPEYESSNNLMANDDDDDDSPIDKEVDLDYYGVFNTRLVDGPIDLSSLDDQNSSILLKDIADSMYNKKYAEILDEEDVLPGTTGNQQGKRTLDQRNNRNRPTGKQKKEPVKGSQKQRKGFSNSPICWAFTGKNKATVQNHRLNLAAKGSVKGSKLTPGEITLAAKAPHHSPDRKLAQLNVSKENVLNPTSNVTMPKKDLVQTHPKSKPQKPADIRPGFTVFGSKTNLQPEAQKFHTSWRPRKPLKPLTTVVFEMPPTPFTNKQLGHNPKL